MGRRTGVWDADREDKFTLWFPLWVKRAVLWWSIVGMCILTWAITRADPIPMIGLIGLWTVSAVATAAAGVATYWSVVIWWTFRRG